MKKSKLLVMSMVGCLTIGGASVYAEGRAEGADRKSPQIQKQEAGVNKMTALEEAGIDMESLKTATPEERATILAEAGIEMPEAPEKAERAEFTGEKGERAETQKGSEFTAFLTEAGIDVATFKDLTQEEQVTILAEAGIEMPEKAEKGERAETQKGSEFTAFLTEAGIDVATFKDLTQEEQATILAEAGIEMPEAPEKGERAEKPEFTGEKGERAEKPEFAGERTERTEMPEDAQLEKGVRMSGVAQKGMR